MKTKILNQLHTSCKKWKTLLLITTLLTLSIGQMWGWELNYPYLYFYDSSESNWSSTMFFYYYKKTGEEASQGFDMSNVAGTKLKYVQVTENRGNALSGFVYGFGATSNWGWESGNNWDSRWGHLTANFSHSGTSQTNLSYGTWYCTSSGSDNLSVSNISNSDALSALNSTQTLNTVVKVGSDSYTSANSKATISISSYELTSQGTTTQRTPSLSTSVSTQTVSACRTATTTFTVGTVASGYQFDGFYTAATGGSLLSSSTTYTYYPTEATTVYARFSEKMSTVTLTASPASKGSFTIGGAAATSTTAGVTTTRSVTAVPIDGYHFVSWSITGGASINSTTANPVTVTGGGAGTAATLTATFEADAVNSLTVSAGTGISSVTGSTSPVTLGSKYPISATVATGYTFSGWTASPAANGVFDNARSTSTNVQVNNGSVAVTASATENMSTLTTSNHYDVGNPSYAIPTKDVSSIGISTTATLTATAPGTGYTFAGWTLSSNLVVTSGNAATDRTITVRTNGNGAAATAQANYTENLTSPWTIKGGTGLTGNNWTTAYNMVKKTGHSTESVAYYTFNVSETNTGDSQKDNYGFKLLQGETWYGAAADGDSYWVNGTMSNIGISTSNDKNIQIRANVAGPYEVKVDYTTPASPKVTVTFPTSYTVTYSVSPAAAADAITTSPSVSSGGLVASGTSVTFTHAAANTGYTWSHWNKGGSNVGEGSTYTTSITSNTTVQAVYSENTYNVTVTKNTSAGGSVTPTSVTAMGQVTGGNITATENTGYNFTNWTITEGTGYFGTTGTSTISTTADTKFRPSSVATICANFTAKTYSITLDREGATTGSTSVTMTYNSSTHTTITAPSKNGYTFGGWWSGDNGTGSMVMNASGVLQANVDGYTGAGGIWTKDATCTLYAKWTPKNYTVTLALNEDHVGSTTDATTSQSVTYNNTTTIIPNRPTGETGYGLDGYYTDHNGAGTKLINGDGTWIASVAGYTDASKKWIHDGDVTLYAYYKKAEITGFTFSTGSTVIAPSTNITVTATVSPTPQPTTHIDWRILHSNDNPLDVQPSFGTGQTTNTFATPSTSGMYKMEATLRTGSTANAGTVLSTYTASFQVAGDHTVTLQYKCGDEIIKASTTMSGKPLVWTSVTAPDIFGYTFSKWVAGDGITLSENGTSAKTTEPANESSEDPIYIKAIYDGKLTAIYTQKSYIYFKNTLGWSSVRVNFYTDNYWGYNTDADKGTGNHSVTNRNLAMSLVEGTTDIYYYDYGTAGITPTQYVSFTQEDMDDYYYFYQDSPNAAHVVYPSRYSDALTTDKATEGGFYAGTPMFVPLASQSAVKQNYNRAEYYNSGYWTKYTPGTGYHLEIYYEDGSTKIRDIDFTSTDELMPMTATANLEAGQTYKFQVKRDGDVYYGNSGEMTYADHGQGTAWEMTNSGFTMCRITTNAAGDYTFKLSYSGNSSDSPEYRLRMAVDYPIADGDYRVIYKHTGQTNWKASAIVPKVNNGKDTVSFFIKPGASPIMYIQQANVDNEGTITWTNLSNVPTATLTSLSGDKVYNVCLTMGASGGASVEKIEPYTGNYYIRTDCANSKWDNYRGDPDHLMTYSEYSIEHGGYSHYYCHWVKTDDRKNIKFTIANDYNPGLSDTLTRETASGDWANITYYVEDNGDIKRNANVRFMWNQNTNVVSRAYVDGAQESGSRFLVISSTDGKIKKADGTALSDNEVTFTDNENWIYEANIQAQPTAQFKLISTWGVSNVITQYFKGSSSTTETLIDGIGSTWYTIRLLYDFKTNRLVAGWVPTDVNITSDNAINADVMFIREHQGDIAQLTFSASGKISKIETAYGVLRFNKYTLANKDKSTHSPLSSPASIYERSLFFISFPFRVKLSEVFGFGTYMSHWAIQRYDGADRAARGHFAENGSFWKWMNRSTEYLEPNQGYLLAIDLDLLGEDADVWGPDSRSEQIELYFPSYGTMPDITSANVAQTLPEHTCTINMHETNPDLPDTGNSRTSYNRTIFDSHWNVMSVPTYVNTSSVAFANKTWTSKVGPKFLYTWNADDNTITATSASGYTYHAMHSYMVQYAGNVTWSASSGSPSSIVARSTYAGKPKEVEFRLELQHDDKMIDRTYVVLSEDEDVSAGFKFGEDMTKEFNANKSSVYTFITNEATVGGNTLPMSDQTTIVPIGVDVITAGDYTFSMPDGTNGIGVTLIDGLTGEQTNLALTDYTVTLEKGTYEVGS